MGDDVGRRLEAVVAVHQPGGVDEEGSRLTADQQKQAVDLPLARVGGEPALRHRAPL